MQQLASKRAEAGTACQISSFLLVELPEDTRLATRLKRNSMHMQTLSRLFQALHCAVQNPEHAAGLQCKLNYAISQPVS